MTECMTGKLSMKIAITAGVMIMVVAIGVTPATAQAFSVSYDDIEFVVSPGDTFVAALLVTNLSEENQTLQVYSGDWVRVPGQTSGYEFHDENGNEPRSFLEWMTYSPQRLELEPGEEAEVYCEVAVPLDPELEGSFWSVIFIEGVPSEEAQIPFGDEEEMNVGISTVFRYAVQIFATIEGTEVREATFNAMEFRQMEGGFDVVAVMENTGNIFMRPEVWLEIHNTEGRLVWEQEHVRQTILPESAREYVFELRELPLESGTYLVMVIANYGVPQLIAAQGRIDISAEESVQGEQ